MSDILFEDETPPPRLAPVVHYAGSEKKLAKALALQNAMSTDEAAFDLTCDCEDGAPVGQEAAHAKLCARFIASSDNRFGRLGLRIHDRSHPAWQADMDIVLGEAGDRLAYVVLPKAKGVEDAAATLDHLAERALQLGIEREIPLHVLIETHGGLREVARIAALPGVESLELGLMDFVSSHHGALPLSAMRSPGQFTHPVIVRAKAEIVAAALAYGKVPTHNVTVELHDDTLIADDARRARAFGFLRMWSIHPAQIAPILHAMLPDAAEIAEAEAILKAAEAAEWGPIRFDGTLHDRASYRYFRDLLRRTGHR
ncbi:MAG: CoA ester lyase [Zoogloeaceae bacterium]|jgi:citrate lyase subunit beta/citryl-CoA lyase|nr:CoA ester lyase [Zoogloeaceae bacterium]